ncbi:MAG: ComEC/Rec2 family competence protein [Coriobacteriia bacterium]|nr:ComEC/Rec2 family competence protein [Coriobacteriia bacterium]
MPRRTIEELVPARPSLSLLCFAFLGFWLGLAASLKVLFDRLCGIDSVFFDDAGTWGLAAIVVGFGVLLLVLWRLGAWRRAGAITLLALLCGVIVGYATVVSFEKSLEKVQRSATGPITIQAIEDSMAGRFGDSQVVEILDGELAGIKARVNYAHDMVPLELGQRATVNTPVTALRLDEQAHFLLNKGVAGQMSVSKFDDPYYGGVWGWMYAYRAQLVELCDEASAHNAITKGILLGDRRGFRADELNEPFSRAGIGHLLAVSGTHLAIVAAGIITIGTMLGLKRAWIQVVTLMVCSGYVVLTGASPSAVRALGMLAVMSLSIWLFRRNATLNALALTGLVCLFVSPLWAISVSFSLSVCAVGAIGLFTKYGSWYLRHAFSWPSRTVADGVAISIVALIASAPILSATFGFFSMMSPVSNLVVAPLFTATLALALCAAAIAWAIPGAAVMLLAMCGGLNRVTIAITERLSSPSWAAIPTDGGWLLTGGVVVLAAAIWWWWPRLKARTIRRAGRVMQGTSLVVGAGFLVVLMLPAMPYPGSRVVVLDVGQGDALLVQCGENAVLIDAGPSPQLLRDQLSTFGVKRIDAVIFTHDHDDHFAGAKALVGSYGTDTIIVADGAESSLKYQKLAHDMNARIVPVAHGSTLSVGTIRLDVWGPLNSVSDPSANETSLILYITAKPNSQTTPTESLIAFFGPSEQLSARSILTGGDAEASQTKEALRANPPHEEAPIDVLKVGHHGSKPSVDEELMEMARPKEAVISVGEKNSYGHPNATILEILGRHLKRVWRTDKDGPISIGLRPLAVAQ